VSLKVQASELGVVLVLEVDRPLAMALLAQAMPLETVRAPVVVVVVVIMVG
jgi:hypothetical protein